MRYALYARVSTQRQQEDHTIETQLDTAAQYCKANKIKLEATYIDDGVTSQMPLAKRVDGSKLVRDAQNKKFDCLLVFKYNRIARKAIDLLSTIELLEAEGIRIISILEPYLNDTHTAGGSYVRNITAATSQFYRDNFKEDSMRGHYRSASQGKWQGGSYPFGYKVVEGKLSIAEEEAAIVRTIFRMYIDGCPTQRIAEELNGKGYGSPRAWRKSTLTIWTDKTVGQILRNEIYTGKFIWRKTTGILKEGRVVKRIESKENERVAYQIPAIVTQVEYDKVKRLREYNQRFAARNLRRNYLLRGMIRCGVCGRTYIGSTVTRPYAVYSYYQCASQTKGKREIKCGNKPIRVDDIENKIRDDLAQIALNPEPVIAELEERLRDRESFSSLEYEQGRVSAALKAKQGERARVLNFARRSVISEAEAEKELRQLRNEVDALEIEHAKLSDLKRRERETKDYLLGIGSLLRQFAEDLKSISDDQYRKYARELIHSIIVNPIEVEGEVRPSVEVAYFVPAGSLNGCSYLPQSKLNGYPKISVDLRDVHQIDESKYSVDKE